jgi:hypothetical protein
MSSVDKSKKPSKKIENNKTNNEKLTENKLIVLWNCVGIKDNITAANNGENIMTSKGLSYKKKKVS